MFFNQLDFGHEFHIKIQYISYIGIVHIKMNILWSSTHPHVAQTGINFFFLQSTNLEMFNIFSEIH